MNAPYALTLAEVRKLHPCEDAIERLATILPKRGKITAQQARDLGCTYDDLIFVASAVAMNDDALARRLTHFVNDNAKRVLHVWEEHWSDDLRPRKAIEACDAFFSRKVEQMTAALFARTPADIDAMKRDAWAGYVSDYILGVDDDPAEARARYLRKMAAIDALQGVSK